MYLGSLLKAFTALLMALALNGLSGRGTAQAFSIEPTFLDMKPVGRGSRSSITVRNSSNRPFPVEVIVSRLTMTENGDVDSRPAEADFLVFPPQAIITPNGLQNFRVQWIGDPGLAEGRIYDITISQVLVDDPADTPSAQGNQTSLSVSLALAFGAVVNMPALSGDPAPVVGPARLVRDAKGQVMMEAVIENRSNQNFLMVKNRTTLSLFDGAGVSLWSRTYDADALLRIFGLGVVQPNKRRTVRIPLTDAPESALRAAVSASMDIRSNGR